MACLLVAGCGGTESHKTRTAPDATRTARPAAAAIHAHLTVALPRRLARTVNLMAADLPGFAAAKAHEPEGRGERQANRKSLPAQLEERLLATLLARTKRQLR